MKVKDRIFQLANHCSLSGNEKSFGDFLCSLLIELGYDAHCDSHGNVVGKLSCGKAGAKTMLLEAHLDQIGLMVSKIEENGYIQFANLGGVDQRILPGMEVKIHGKQPVYGIIGACLPEAENGKGQKNLKVDEYRIDTGLSYDVLKELISVGDFVQMEGETIVLNKDTISGIALDNRVGIVSVLMCAQRLKDVSLNYDICVLFSSQEELGLRGAYTGIRDLDVDGAIVVDVTHGTTADTKKEIGVFPLGSGAIICRGPNFHYDYTKQLITTAKNRNIPFEIEVASKESGTTAWAIQTSNGGIPVMLVSVPLRYMHTNVETVHCKDVEAVAQLLFGAVMGGVELA